MVVELKILVCDDEQIFTDMLSKRLSQEFSKHTQGFKLLAFNDSLKLLEYVKQNDVDVLFLDVDMPNLNGLETAEKIQRINSKVAIIFITNHDDMAFYTCKYQPFWFIRKSHIDDLTEAIEKLVRKMNAENRTYTLETSGEIINVQLDHVLYFESEDHYVTMNMQNDTKTFKAKIGDIEKQLALFDFIRIHIGFLVNIAHIYKISSDVIELKNGMCLPISRKNVKLVKENFQKYMRSLRW